LSSEQIGEIRVRIAAAVDRLAGVVFGRGSAPLEAITVEHFILRLIPRLRVRDIRQLIPRVRDIPRVRGMPRLKVICQADRILPGTPL
jgi:hypothetical protein